MMADESRIPEVTRVPRGMRRSGRLPRPALVAVLLLVLFGGMSNSLTGCATERLSVTGITLGGGTPPALSGDARAQFGRLETEFARLTQNSQDQQVQLGHLSDAFRRVRADY